MWKKLFSILAASLAAMSVAINWQAFAQQREYGVLAHLSAYSESQEEGAHHASPSLREHIAEKSHGVVVADHPTHKHRHAPNEPEHEHTHPVSTHLIPPMGIAPIGFTLAMHAPIHRPSIVAPQIMPTGELLSAIFRPPIA